MNGSFFAQLAVYKDAVNRLIQFQFAAVAKKGDVSETTYTRSKILMMALGAVALILATAMVKALAQGKLGTEIAVKWF